jgi:hypothetical protein
MLFSGPPGVEFKQFAWLFYHTVADDDENFKFITLDCRLPQDQARIQALIRNPNDHSGVFYIKDLQDLEIAIFRELANSLPSLPDRSRRLFLSGFQDPLEKRESEWAEICSAFANPAEPHFKHLKIPSLSNERQRDIVAYIHYSISKGKRKRQIHPWALDVLSSQNFKLNYQSLVQTMETLLNRSEDVITLLDLPGLSNMERTLTEKILECETIEQLMDHCRNFLDDPSGDRVQKINPNVAEDHRCIYATLDLLNKADAGDGSAIDDLLACDSFWPIHNYPMGKPVLEMFGKKGIKVKLDRS